MSDSIDVPKSWNNFGPPKAESTPTLDRGTQGEGLGGSSSRPAPPNAGANTPDAKAPPSRVEPPDPLIHRSIGNYNPETFAQCISGKGFPEYANLFDNEADIENTLLKTAATVLEQVLIFTVGGAIDEAGAGVAGAVTPTLARLQGASDEVAAALGRRAKTWTDAGGKGMDLYDNYIAPHLRAESGGSPLVKPSNITRIESLFNCAKSSGVNTATIQYNAVMSALGSLTAPAPTPPPLVPVTKVRPSPWRTILIAGAAGLAVGGVAIGIIAANNPTPGPGPTPVASCVSLSNIGCIPVGTYVVQEGFSGSLQTVATWTVSPGGAGEVASALNSAVSAENAQCASSGCARATYVPWNGSSFGFDDNSAAGTFVFRVTRTG